VGFLVGFQVLFHAELRSILFYFFFQFSLIAYLVAEKMWKCTN
jgi:hypothetical protein